MPAGNRGYQTVFWNIGYFDKPYFEGVFGDFVFPDGTKPKWETLSWLQKHFMKWFNKERERYVLTFPVETMALLTDGSDDFADKEYADFTAQMWADGHSFFCYLSNSPDSLSSCCRLRNSLKEGDDEHNHTTHQYSMGTASVATGSKSVMTMNLPRVIQNATRKYFMDNGIILNNGENIAEQNLTYDKVKLYEYIRKEVRELTERIHKYQSAFNETIKDFLEANMLDAYDAGFINMRKQYLTVGVNGITDAADFLGIDVNVNDEYKEFVNNILETINISNKKDKTRDCMYNTEFVPGENLSAKNYKWDKKDGYWVSPKRNLYSSYFYNPEDDGLNVLDKMKLHGNNYVNYLDGGSACHINLNEHLSQPQYRQLMKVAAAEGTNYFTFNIKNTVCNDCGYISKHTLDKCPHCESENLDYLTRVIGYLTRISSLSEPRQEEAGRRVYH
jgi:ribonucleoside-triphosphate reductase